MMPDTTELYILILVYLTLNQWRVETSVPCMSQSFELIWIEFGILLKLVGLLNLIFILFLFHLINIQERNPHLASFIK